eukprot:gene2862-3126_t
MGNGQHRYLTNNDAVEIIGSDRWTDLRLKLERPGVKGIDFELFAAILASRFDRMPGNLCEAVFRAFSSDPQGRVDMDVFISSLAVLYSNNPSLILKFLGRIYENGYGVVERRRMEEILLQAYGNEKLRAEQTKWVQLIDSLFSRRRMEISLREFESWSGPLEPLLEWVVKVVDVVAESPPTRLLALHRRYSSLTEGEQVLRRFHPSTAFLEHLRQVFQSRSGGSGGGGGGVWSLASWQRITVPLHLPAILAEVIFLAKARSFSESWRFADLLEVVLLYGQGSWRARAEAVLAAFIAYDSKLRLLRHSSTSNSITSDGEKEEEEKEGKWRVVFCRMVHLLAQSVETLQMISVRENKEVHEEVSARSPPEEISGPIFSRNRPRAPSLNLEADQEEEEEQEGKRVTAWPSQASLYLRGATLPLAEPLADRLSKLMTRQPPLLPFTPEEAVDFLVKSKDLLPCLRALPLVACCLFGLQPAVTTEEKEFVVELTLRHVQRAPQSSSQPYGPPGTRWALLSKTWYDSWRLFVGSAASATVAGGGGGNGGTAGGSNSGGGGGGGGGKKAIRPGSVDNWNLLVGSDSRALVAGVTVGQDVEIVAPRACQALLAWYGGGPYLTRRVIPAIASSSGVAELELYPLCLFFLGCDAQGRVLRSGTSSGQEMLFSRTATIADIITEVSAWRGVTPARVRLWDYSSPRDGAGGSGGAGGGGGTSVAEGSRMLSPAQSLLQAGLVNGQQLLVEISLADGSWPRAAILHAEDESNPTQNIITTSAATSSFPTRVFSAPPRQNGLMGSGYRLRRNDGLIGLENLGNTCYLNSSLQALLHTGPLADYFLLDLQLADINPQNPMGYGGRLAQAFARLTKDLWSAPPGGCLAPRAFYNDLTHLQRQFAGNDQHDAHELLASLLDGLTEDCNLVTRKNTTSPPDSLNRDEEELAEIWWRHHLLRECSVVQALFAGQFRTITRCPACDYQSIRYEPFTCLALPIPEELSRSLTVLVFPRKIEYSCRVAVRVDKNGSVADLVRAVIALSIDGLQAEEEEEEEEEVVAMEEEENTVSNDKRSSWHNKRNSFGFLAADLFPSNLRVRAFLPLDKPLDIFGDQDLIALFQTSSCFSRSAAPVKTSSPAVKEGEEEEENSDYKDTDSSVRSPRAHTTEFVQPVVQETRVAPMRLEEVEEEVNKVRIAFCQRRVSQSSGRSLGLSGVGMESFRPVGFGLPMLEELPAQLPCSQLYDLIATRLTPFLRAPVAALRAHHLRQRGSAELETEVEETCYQLPASADSQHAIHSATTEEVVAGGLPRRGFTLRLVTGGTSSGVACSRCPWIARCQGCVLPDASEVVVHLQDGETIAIDWHFIVAEEVLDTTRAGTIRSHPTLRSNSGSGMTSTTIALDKCWERFTAEEVLDGALCSQEHTSGKEHTLPRPPVYLRQQLAIWRLPPVLLLQLKRFQFDRTARRKLTPTITFPFAGLDLNKYLFPRNRSSAHTAPSCAGEDGTMSPIYDLYAVIHHIGALTGGHYVTTVRQTRLRDGRHSNNNSSSGSNSSSHATSEDVVDVRGDGDGSPPTATTSDTVGGGGGGGGAGKWYCLNDNLVTPVTDLREIVSPSAYVLLYIRRDLAKYYLGSGESGGGGGGGGGKEGEDEQEEKGIEVLRGLLRELRAAQGGSEDPQVVEAQQQEQEQEEKSEGRPSEEVVSVPIHPQQDTNKDGAGGKAKGSTRGLTGAGGAVAAAAGGGGGRLQKLSRQAVARGLGHADTPPRSSSGRPPAPSPSTTSSAGGEEEGCTIA